MLVSRQIVEEHCSVEQSRRAQAEPISLDSCLKAFTSEEELGEDELYYCSKCKTHRLATKKLDLWRLPPILVGGARFLLCGRAGGCHLPRRFWLHTDRTRAVLSPSDRPPEALPVRERPLDQVAEDSQVPEGELRPQRLPGAQGHGAAVSPLAERERGPGAGGRGQPVLHLCPSRLLQPS